MYNICAEGLSPLQMPPSSQPKDIADFFRPYSRHLTSSIPRKRPAPTVTEDATALRGGALAPKTPNKSVSFKDVTPSPGKPTKPLEFSLATDTSLPIRSPRTIRTTEPLNDVTNSSSPTKTSPIKPRTVDAKPNVSFTFSDTSERSNNVIKDGMLVAVRDSDEDSNDSLESIGAIFKGRKQKNHADEDVTSMKDDSDDDVEDERVRTLSMFTHGRSVPIVGKSKLRALQMKDRSAKFDLSKILQDHHGAEEADARIRRARQISADEDENETSGNVDKDMLASVIRQTDHERDENEVSRLLHAVERTEALEGKKVYSFFGATAYTDDIDEFMNEAFPSSEIPYKLWDPQERGGCGRAYLSGYMTDLAACGRLSDDAMRWTFNQVQHEQQDHLRQSYIRTVQAGSKMWTRINLTATNVQEIFRHLGAHKSIVRDNTTIEPRYEATEHQSRRDIGFLLSTIDMFTRLCPDMDMLALSRLVSITLRLSLDSTAMSNASLCFAVETLLSTLIDLCNADSASHIHNRIITDLSHNLHDPKLQATLLSHIQPISPPSTQLRKTLADIFLLGASALKPGSATSTASFDTLTAHISTSPTFSLARLPNHPPPDYSLLTSRIAILDIAIGSGDFFPTAPQPAPSSSSQPQSSPTERTLEPSLKSQINAFNTSLDALANTLHNLFTSIKDTGASHMRRTETKDALQALHFRLLYSVRIGLRKKRQVFEMERAGGVRDVRGSGGSERGVKREKWVARDTDEVEGEKRAGEFMRRFLEKTRRTAGGGEGEVQREGDEDGEGE